MIKKKGFTLIELLVVVAIIGLLATLSVVALNTARAKARDAKRVADVKQIQTALELYYNNSSNGYPTASASTSLSALIPAYMGQFPSAPIPADSGLCNTTNNAYTYTGGTNTYILTYCLGAATGGLGVGPATATPQGLDN